MKKTLTLFALFVFSQVIISNLFPQWEKVSDISGRVWSIAACDERIFIGTEDNGLYYSDDFFKTYNKHKYRNVTDIFFQKGILFSGFAYSGIDFRLYQSTDCGLYFNEKSDDIYALCHLIKDETIFVGTGGQGIFFSNDNGVTWINTVPKTNKKSSMYVRGITDANGIIFCGTQDGIFKSTDNGYSWINSSIGFDFEFIMDVCFLEGRLFAGTGRGIYVSDDYGRSWKQNYNPYSKREEYGYICCFEKAGDLIFAGSKDGVFFSSNQGESWSVMNDGLIDKYIFELFCINNTLFAGTDGSVYKIDISNLMSGRRGNNSNDLGKNLIAYYPFNDNANDESGNNNHGTLMNSPVFSEGVKGNGIFLTGRCNYSNFCTGSTGDHVELPAMNLESMRNFTINIWVKEQQMLMNQGESYISFGDHTNGCISISHFQDKITFTVFNNSVSIDFYKNDLNKFVMYTLVYNNGQIKGYKNGEVVAMNSQRPISNSKMMRGTIARHYWYDRKETSTRFTGMIDEIRIYDKSLNNEEVKEILNLL